MCFDKLFSDDFPGWLEIRVLQIFIRCRNLTNFCWFLAFAAMMDMPLKKAFPAIAVGVFIAAVVVSVITYGATVVF